MPNQKISELTAIVTVDNSVDVLPIVDISANTTKKVTPNALKTALALDNVNNTSDANKPVSIAQQDALNAKVDENAPIVAATKTKITYDAKGLVTAGDILDAADMPTGINAANIGTGVVSSTEFGYLDGVTSAIQTQINAKQATLVSGTNIKTINSTSLLGSGDITISANPSGVSGAIQFSNGSAFASDASNLFWDDTNNRLGVGTNAPTATAHFRGIGNTSLTTALLVQNSSLTDILSVTDNAFVTINSGFVNIQTNGVAAPTGGAGLMFNLAGSGQGMSITNQNAITYRIGQYAASNVLSLGSSSAAFNINTSSNIGIGLTNPTARTHIQGSGSTSATTSLLVQNSAGTQMMRMGDAGYFFAGNSSANTYIINDPSDAGYFATQGPIFLQNGGTTSVAIIGQRMSIGKGSSYADASSTLELSSTTRGFLPPRMTTTQKNAIASPAAGLVVYDSTTNKLCCYNGSTWNDLF
jgi:hypothetical protein